MISTHTLRKEGDYMSFNPVIKFFAFQPTPSARRVTQVSNQLLFSRQISTHTLRKEGD